MITFEEARAIAQDEIDRQSGASYDPVHLVLLHAMTQVEPYGWVFYYDSAKHVATQAFENMLLGNAPLLVLRDTGEVRILGTAHPTDYYLAPYRAAHGEGRSTSEVKTPW